MTPTPATRTPSPCGAVRVLHRYHTLDALMTASFDDAVDAALAPLCRLQELLTGQAGST
jgi:hypothetical protein